MVSPENLFAAWKVFRSNKRNRHDVAEFERDLERHIFRLHRELEAKDYRHGPYHGFWISDPKLRRIHKATVRDRVLHHAIFRILNPIFEPTFIPNSFSCRVGKGTHKGMKTVAAMLRAESRNNTRPCFALKCDVRKFFDSVDHARLLAILEKRIIDPDARWLLREVIESYSTENRAGGVLKGIPIGNLTSQLFANVYMNEFDQFVKHQLHVLHYARYTDDFVIVSSDRKYLESLVSPVASLLRERLKLELHPQKISIRSYRQGIDFLGYIILPHHIVIRTKTRRRIFRKLKERAVEYRKGAITEAQFDGVMRSYLGVLSHANAYDIRTELLNKIWFWLHE